MGLENLVQWTKSKLSRFTGGNVPVTTSRAPASLLAGAIAMAATGPAARPAHAFLQLLLGPANAAFSSLLLLRILDPTDELVAGERRDVVPSSERGEIREQRLAQVVGEFVHDPTGDSLAAHAFGFSETTRTSSSDAAYS